MCIHKKPAHTCCHDNFFKLQFLIFIIGKGGQEQFVLVQQYQNSYYCIQNSYYCVTIDSDTVRLPGVYVRESPGTAMGFRLIPPPLTLFTLFCLSPAFLCPEIVPVSASHDSLAQCRLALSQHWLSPFSRYCRCPLQLEFSTGAEYQQNCQ